MPKEIIQRYTREMIEINGSWYLPVSPESRAELERDLKENYSKEKHQVQIEVAKSHSGKIFEAFWFIKK